MRKTSTADKTGLEMYQSIYSPPPTYSSQSTSRSTALQVVGRLTVLLLFFILPFLLLSSPFSASARIEVVQGWYGVEPWEIEFCSKYAGAVDVTTHSRSGAAQKNRLTATTYTIQAEKTKRYDGSFVYEFAWYVHPVVANVPYEITLINATERSPFKKGTATPVRATIGYEASPFTNDVFDLVEITVGEEKQQIPILCSNCEH